MKWDLIDTIDLVRRWEKVLRDDGWHLALAGGVLHRGRSYHDLDLIAYPHDMSRPRRRKLIAGLRALGATRLRTAPEMRAHWRTKGSRDTKHVEVWRTDDGRRVDVIILDGRP